MVEKGRIELPTFALRMIDAVDKLVFDLRVQ